MENEYKLGYCGHFGVFAIGLCFAIAEIQSFYCFCDNRYDNSNNHSEQKNAQS